MIGKKMYSVYSLDVVKVKNDNHYFICKKKDLNTYIEIFTNEKINVSDISNIETLANYYPLIMRIDFENGEPVMVSEKDLLKKLINININIGTELEKNEPLETLEKATLNFFPKKGVWCSRCFTKPEGLDIANLPCHLRDDLWLAKMLKKEHKLFSVSTHRILQFVKTSPFFQEKRHEYEQEIVKWQIDWMKSDGEGWITDENYGGDFSLCTSVCDLAFRKGIIDTLSKIGMNVDAIEEGIEKNANMWREPFMMCAFRNEYEPVILVTPYSIESNNVENIPKLPPTDKEHKEKWLKMRKYEYYQKHKDSVDKYGVVEPDMTLSSEEVKELKIYLDQKHCERMAQINQYKEEKSKITGKAKILK